MEKTKKRQIADKETNFSCADEFVRCSNTDFFQHEVRIFYRFPKADMEELRKVALEIENNDMLKTSFHDYRKDLESVVSVKQEDPERRCFLNLTATMNIPEDTVKQCVSLVTLR